MLPLGGNENPYQLLTRTGLQETDIEVVDGATGRWFAFLRTQFLHRPSFIHLDWLHSYYLSNHPGLTVLRVLSLYLEIWLIRLCGIRIVWTVHNLYPHDRPVTSWQTRLRKTFARACYRIRIFSNVTRSEVINHFGVSDSILTVIPEGSYSGFYPNTINRKEARRMFDISEKDFVFLYLGSMRRYKGIVELIEAFGRLPLTLRPRPRLLLAGGGNEPDLMNEIRNRAQRVEGVLLHDQFVPEERIQLYYAAADVVVLPFKRITNSGSVILAMTFGKAVLTRNAGAVSTRLCQQKEWLYDRDDELFAQLERAVKTPSEIFTAIGAVNRIEVEQYQWSDLGRYLQKLA